MSTPAVKTVTPTTVDELRDAVLDHPGTLRVAGAGTAADWAGTPAPADTVLDVTALSGIVTHNPGDMTVEVRAGTPFAALQDELAQHHQRVAVDPARAAEGATLGGLFATADSGPRSLQYGSLRDLVIGATVVLPDGTTAHSGGHVIKNVAGYDLTKVLHGAHGTLAVIAGLVLRLHPTPRSTPTVARADRPGGDGRPRPPRSPTAPSRPWRCSGTPTGCSVCSRAPRTAPTHGRASSWRRSGARCSPPTTPPPPGTRTVPRCARGPRAARCCAWASSRRRCPACWTGSTPTPAASRR